jgi:nitrogenase molybdenum-cofactor synthesis protein NifE
MKAPSAALNVVQCAGSSVYLAKQMEETFGIPYFRVSFFGVEDTSQSIMHVAEAIGSEATIQQARVFTESEREKSLLFLKRYLPHFEGKKAAIYVGGGFKAISLIRQFREMGIDTVVVGTQTGKKEDYEVIENLVKPNTVILDDTNPAELEMFMRKMHADILVGGVKERPLAYKLGIAFCDHNHERKHALGGYEGVVNFTREVNLSLNSPVWNCLAGR